MCQVLLGQGADSDKQDKNGWTALHCCAKAGYLNAVKLLVDTGCQTKKETEAGKIPLWYAVMENNRYVMLKCCDSVILKCCTTTGTWWSSCCGRTTTLTP